MGAWQTSISTYQDESWPTKIRKAIQEVKISNDMLVKERNQSRKKQFQEQFREVKEAKMLLQNNWESLSIRLQLDQAQETLHTIRLDKLEKFQHKMASQWVRTGDRCTKEFFEFHKGLRAMLLVEGQNEYTTQEAIQGYITEYYRTIYRADQETEVATDLRKECLKSVPRVVTEEQNRWLERPLRTKELQIATEDLSNGKAAGPNGVPVEFFKTLWPEMGKK